MKTDVGWWQLARARRAHAFEQLSSRECLVQDSYIRREVARGFQDAARRTAYGRIIVDEQNGAFGLSSALGVGGVRIGKGEGTAAGQENLQRRASPQMVERYTTGFGCGTLLSRACGALRAHPAEPCLRRAARTPCVAGLL